MTFAEGGLVRGPGTDTSDSIFARLSDREFVMSAKATRFWGPEFMDDLNNLTSPKAAMAGGGLVSTGITSNFASRSSSGSSGGSASQVIHMHFNSSKEGAFSKQSAEQAGRSAITAMNRFQNKTN